MQEKVISINGNYIVTKVIYCFDSGTEYFLEYIYIKRGNCNTLNPLYTIEKRVNSVIQFPIATLSLLSVRRQILMKSIHILKSQNIITYKEFTQIRENIEHTYGNLLLIPSIVVHFKINC